VVTQDTQPAGNVGLAKAGLMEVIEHLYFYQHLCLTSADGFQIPCLRQAVNRCGETPLRYVRHIVAADYIRLNVLRIASHIKRIGKITTLANFVYVS